MYIYTHIYNVPGSTGSLGSFGVSSAVPVRSLRSMQPPMVPVSLITEEGAFCGSTL